MKGYLKQIWTCSELMGILELVGTLFNYKPNYKIRKYNFTEVLEQKDDL